MHTKDFPVVDWSKMQCCGASVSLASEKKHALPSSIPCWKVEESQELLGSLVISHTGLFCVRITQFSKKDHNSFAVLINSNSTYNTFKEKAVFFPEK